MSRKKSDPYLAVLLLSDTQCLKIINAANGAFARFSDSLETSNATAATAFRDVLLQELQRVRAAPQGET